MEGGCSDGEEKSEKEKESDKKEEKVNSLSRKLFCFWWT